MHRYFLSALIFVFLFSPTASVAKTPINAELRDRIDKVKKSSVRSEDNRVIVGKVVVEGADDPTLVKSQMLILKDGFFAGVTKDAFRQVGFRMHGYAPFDLDLVDKKFNVTDGKVIDVGIIQMKRIPKEKLLNVKGAISLQGSGDSKSARIAFSVANGPVNTPSNGTEPRRKYAKSIIVSPSETGVFEHSGFSPIRYYCSITAPGHVQHGFYVDFSNNEDAFLGRIRVEKQRTIQLEYIVSKNRTFDVDTAKETTTSSGQRWKATPDIYGWDLEFTQNRQKIGCTHSYGPCKMADLGEGGLSDFADKNDHVPTRSPRGISLHDGHVYLLLQQHWKRNVLLKVKLNDEESTQ